MAIWGTQRLYCYDPRSNLKQRGIPVEIQVGPPVDASGDPERATERLRAAIIDLVGRAQADYPDDGTGHWWQPARLGGTAPSPGSTD